MATPIVIDGRATYLNLGQFIFDTLEANGWTKEMSVLTDAVMKKNYNGSDHFVFFTPITADGYQTTVGNAEGYTRGKTGVTCAYTETTTGSPTVAEVGTITVQNFCTTAGNYNFRFKDGTIDVTIPVPVLVTDNTTNLVATKLKTAIDANTTFMASYTTSISNNIITFTKKANGITPVVILFDIGITGVAGVFVNKNARTLSWGSTTVASASYVSVRIYLWDDHFVIGVNPDTGVANSQPFLLYSGSPKSYGGVKLNNWGDMIGGTCLEAVSVYPVRNRTGATNRPTYQTQGSIAPINPGEDGLMYISPMSVANATDGIRGDFQDIYGLPASGVQHLDTLTKGGIVHDIWISGTTGSTTFAGTKVIAVFNRTV